jgi:hypothetical protein
VRGVRQGREFGLAAEDEAAALAAFVGGTPFTAAPTEVGDDDGGYEAGYNLKPLAMKLTLARTSWSTVAWDASRRKSA